MSKRLIQLLLLLLAQLFGPVAPAWAGTGSQEAGRRLEVNLKMSLHPFVTETFEQVGLVQVDVGPMKKNVVYFELLGSRSGDRDKANRDAGFGRTFDKDFTWHHHEVPGVMMRLDEKLHKKMQHPGGRMIRNMAFGATNRRR